MTKVHYVDIPKMSPGMEFSILKTLGAHKNDEFILNAKKIAKAMRLYIERVDPNRDLPHEWRSYLEILIGLENSGS